MTQGRQTGALRGVQGRADCSSQLNWADNHLGQQIVASGKNGRFVLSECIGAVVQSKAFSRK